MGTGSGWGLDTAAVIRATTQGKRFGRKTSGRLKMFGLLAMPIRKQQ